jgi:hypothetical protein
VAGDNLATAVQDHPTYYEPTGSKSERLGAEASPASDLQWAREAKRRRRLVLQPFDYQRELVEHALPARFNFLAWGTKAGKTTSAVMRMTRLLWETKDMRYRWIAPFSYQTEIGRLRILRLLPKGYFTYQAKHQIITGPRGSQLSFHSGERPDTLPGDDVDGAVLDEASRLREEVFTNTVSTLLATRGWLMAISTPHGRNWFYQQCKKAWQGEKDYFFRRYTSQANPTMDKATMDHTRRSLPEFIFREMVLAEFISQTAATFPDMMPCSTPTLPRNGPQEGRQYLLAVDVGQIRDRNVITIWDVFDAAIVSWAVAHGRDYTLIASDIQYLSKIWNEAPVLIERNGPGIPIIQMLNARGCNLAKGPSGDLGFTTTGGNKPALVHSWGLALRNGEPLLPSRDKWPDLYTEHENFEYTITKAGYWTFEAAPGFHDDIVMSCLIGWWGITHNQVAPSWWRPGEGGGGAAPKADPRDKTIMNP